MAKGGGAQNDVRRMPSAWVCSLSLAVAPVFSLALHEAGTRAQVSDDPSSPSETHGSKTKLFNGTLVLTAYFSSSFLLCYFLLLSDTAGQDPPESK